VTSGRSIAAGSYHSLYVDDLTLRAWAWGTNMFGQLGNGTTTDRILPVQLAGLSSVSYMSAHGYRSMAVQTEGTVWTWGMLTPGPNASVPTQVPGLIDVQRIAAGWFHSIALRSDGTVWT
jgi:alpha-tubulin suppressor-like RCC1 family protein